MEVFKYLINITGTMNWQQFSLYAQSSRPTGLSCSDSKGQFATVSLWRVT